MTRRVEGHFQEHGRGNVAPPSLAPYVVVRFGPEPSGPAIEALIDTGADWTALGPRDALTLLGRRYIEIDFDRAPGRIEIAGFGQGDTNAVISPMELWLRDVEGEDFSVSLQVAICEPSPRTPGPHGNWLIPSLLGRDILEWFDLTLSYNPPSVTLTEAAPV